MRAELARLAEFGKDRPNPSGGIERGLTLPEITSLHGREFRSRQGRATSDRPSVDERRMAGPAATSWARVRATTAISACAEVRTLFVERRLPDRIAARLRRNRHRRRRPRLRRLVKAAARLIALALHWRWPIVAITEFPDQLSAIAAAKARAIAAAAVAELARRPRRPIGSTRTGPPKTGTGSTMRARAPRPFRCPMPGLSRWNSRGFVCSADPAC